VDGVAPEFQDQPIKVVALANYRFISTGYFEAMHIGLRRGRLLEASDRGKNVVLISERTAERVWPGQNPLGKRFRRGNSKDLVREIIGVVQDTRVAMQKEPVLTVYVPQWAITRETIRPILVMRTVVDPYSVVGAVRAAVRSADPEVPIPAMKTMDDIVEASVAQRRFQMLLTSLFAGAAMLLASLGIYGVVSYSVARRTNEMGIRMALGAGAPDLRRMVLRQGMFPVWIGLAAGLFVALSLGRLVSSLLYGVKATDPLTFAVVAATLAIAAALACYLPARRATRIDPLAALRYE
jgi:predicted permease